MFISAYVMDSMDTNCLIDRLRKLISYKTSIVNSISHQFSCRHQRNKTLKYSK